MQRAAEQAQAFGEADQPGAGSWQIQHGAYCRGVVDGHGHGVVVAFDGDGYRCAGRVFAGVCQAFLGDPVDRAGGVWRQWPGPVDQVGTLTGPHGLIDQGDQVRERGRLFPQHSEHRAQLAERFAGGLTVSNDGTVHFKGKTWTPVGDGLYRATDGSDHLVARGGYVATDGPAYQAMRRSETLPVNLMVLLMVLLLGLSGLGVLLVAAFRRRPVTLWRASRLLASGAAGLAVVFLVLLLVVLLSDTSTYLYGVPLNFRLLLTLPIVVLLGGTAALAGTVIAWRRPGAGLIARSHQIAVLISLAAFAWFTWQWNLIGWHLG